MTYRDFTKTVDEHLQNMTEEEKTKWIHELARKQKEHQWNDFLASFTGSTQTDYSKQIKEIYDFISKVEDGELYFDCEEVEYYEEGYWESDYRTEYKDSMEIGEKLSQAFDITENLLNNKQYQQAAELYEQLCTISVTVFGDYGDYDPLDLTDMINEELISVSTKAIGLNLLYSHYQCLSGSYRIKRFIYYFSQKMFDKIKFNEILTVGPEELNNINDFLEDWICALSELKTNRSGELLTEACLEIGGVERLHKEAQKLYMVHPVLYENLCKQYMDTEQYEKCEDAGLEALAKIQKNLTIRSRIAYMLLSAALKRGNTEIIPHVIIESFYSRSSLNNFFRLFDLPDYKKIAADAARYVESLQNDSPSRTGFFEWSSYGIKNTRKYDQWEINSLTLNDKIIICFFNMEFESVIEKCKLNKGFLGWSSGDIRGVIVPLFLLMMNKNNDISKAGKALVNDIIHKLDFEEHDNQTFIDSFLIWKDKVSLTNGQFEYISQWLREMVQKRTDAVVGGNYRKSYHKAAKLIVALGEMLESNKDYGAKEREIAYYKKLHSRKSAFRSELDDLK